MFNYGEMKNLIDHFFDRLDKTLEKSRSFPPNQATRSFVESITKQNSKLLRSEIKKIQTQVKSISKIPAIQKLMNLEGD